MQESLRPLILGTRGSALALAQSGMVQAALESLHPGLRIHQRIISTTGDERAAIPLHEPIAEGAGLFTKQLEVALLNREIDLAVHSLKDLPVRTPDGLTLGAILPRASVDDLLVSRHSGGVEGLPFGATVGSSSPRRSLLLKQRRPDVVLIPIRGNVPTRLSKVATQGPFDATILAEAGLKRLGHDVAAGKLDVDGTALFLESLEWMLPAPAQGAIAVECRAGDSAEQLLSFLHDESTARCVEAERLVLAHLGGGCHLALGAHAVESPEGIALSAVFVPDPEAAPRKASAVAPTPQEAARRVADQLLSA